MATPKEVMEILSVLAACYPAYSLQPQTVRVYAELLADIDADILATAAKQCAAQSKFFPSVAELREMTLSFRARLDDRPDAYQAWDELMRLCQRLGYQTALEQWDTLTFRHPLVGQVGRRFWRDICMADVSDLGTIRAQFRGAYDALTGRADHERRALPQTNRLIHQLAEALSVNRLASGQPEAR